MPYTRKQVRYLLSEKSPMDSTEKAKVKAELHTNPEMGRKQKSRDVESHAFDWRKRRRPK